MLGPERHSGTEVFVDREPILQLYRSELWRSHDMPRVLNLTGIGGVGKSRVLAELRRMAPDAVRTAVVDFEAPGLNQREAVLMHLREQFRHQGVRFDRFDIAYAVLWQRLHPHLRISTAEMPFVRESEILSEIVANAGNLPMVAGAVGLLRLVDRLRVDVQRRARIRNDATLQRLDELSEPGRLTDLARVVGWLFIDELCAASVDRPFVIFMDCYEALVPQPVRRGRVAATDDWLRRLIGSMDRGLTVIAGREPLGWEQHDRDWTDRTVVAQLDGLPEPAMEEFLQAAGVADPEDRRLIARQSLGLPFYLHLAADTGGGGVLGGGGRVGVVPTHAILDRFLQHVGQEVEAVLQWLGVARVFDFSVFRRLTCRFYLPSDRLAWETLTAYSFVQEVAPGLFRLHQVMSAALVSNLSAEDAADAHICLAEAWSAQVANTPSGDAVPSALPLVAMGETVYHGLRAGTLTGERILTFSDQAVLSGGKQAAAGILQEVKDFVEARSGATAPDLVALARCLEGESAILVGDVRKALELTGGLDSDPSTALGARLAIVRGDAHRISGSTREALRMYTDVWSLHEGEARWKAGLSAADLHMCQGRFIQAEELAAGIETHCGANQHELLGDVARLRHLALRMSFDFEGSAEWLSRARHLYDAAGSFVGRANAQTNILEQLAFTDPGEAISIADRVIRLHQEAGALHELGKAWTALGVAQTRQGELDAAEVSLCEADQVLRRARYRSGRARAMLFRGMVCLRRGDLQGADEAARESMHRLARAEVYPTLILMGSCLLELMGTVDPCTRAEAERARDAIRATDSTEKIEARMSRLLAVMIHS